jgi:Flp pilus assembly protein TadG
MGALGMSRRGQSLLEAALMMLVFLPLLMGIMDVGQFLYFHQALSERASAAARWGAVNPFDSAKIANVAIYNDPAGPTNGASAVLPYLTTRPGTDGYVSATLLGAGTDDARITVTIASYPNSFLIMPSAISHRTVYDTQPYEIGR